MRLAHNIPAKESDKVEFKSTFNMDCIETLVAFANHKGGSVYVGISDEGKITGVSTGKETLRQWINEIKGKTEPAIVPEINTIRLETDKSVIVLSVEEFPIKPVSVKGKYYKRVDASNHLLSLNDIVNMHTQTFNSSWDYYLDSNHYISDISEDKVFKIIALCNKNKIIPIENNVLEFLTKMELLREGKLTHAAFLLLVHRDYSHHGESSIKIFNDRIEFFNPGRLPDSISEEDLRKGSYVSNCRNKLIARIFKEITWIERYGTGIKRVTSLFESHGCPKPVFGNFQHGFRVTAYPVQGTEAEKILENLSELGKKGTEKGTEKITKNQQLIINSIMQDPHVTSEELSDIVGIRSDKIRVNISKLVDLSSVSDPIKAATGK
jgi:predicted HTH transcriptional regulator